MAVFIPVGLILATKRNCRRCLFQTLQFFSLSFCKSFVFIPQKFRFLSAKVSFSFHKSFVFFLQKFRFLSTKVSFSFYKIFVFFLKKFRFLSTKVSFSFNKSFIFFLQIFKYNFLQGSGVQLSERLASPGIIQVHN